MDYNLIILLVAILTMCIFVSHKMDSLKKSIEEKNKQLSTTIENNAKHTRSTFQSDLDGCVSKIKKIKAPLFFVGDKKHFRKLCFMQFFTSHFCSDPENEPHPFHL